MSRPRMVVVGNGMVAMSLLEELATAESPFDVTVFGDEPGPAYDRIKLSGLLAGECDAASLELHGREWYGAHGFELRDGRRVVAVERERRTVVDESGEETPYDMLVLATGSDPLMPPIHGSRRRGVFGFRSLGDVAAILDAASSASRAVVVGGGLLGLEAAHGLRRRGLDVSVVHLAPTLMERQLDSTGGEMLLRELRLMDVEVHVGARTEAFTGNGRVEGVRLAGGAHLDAELVVVACGIVPRTELAVAAGVHVARGVVVDDRMRTSDPQVAAVGECTEHRGVLYGLVGPLRRQARTLARGLLGDGEARFRAGAVATTLKVAGVQVFSAGDVAPAEDGEDIVLTDVAARVHKRIRLRDGRVQGAVLVGDLSTAPLVTAALAGSGAVADRLALVAAAAPAAGGDAVAALPDDAVVCGCNGVTRAQIVAAIDGRNCATRKEVTACTRAGGSCGSCAPLVDALLAWRGRAQAPPPRHVCATCLPVERETVREQALARNLRSVSAVLRELGNGTGCAACKPALAYLLDVTWCGAHEEERSARFVNDRVHANIQRDGTFSVVPRMFGGVTSAQELRRIADVAERHAVPMVKLTGGQRIDLLGVRKEQLPAIWAELGMPSGHAYAKALRTVKTCVGSEFCRFGVGDSTALGIAMEKLLWGLYTPHKVKCGVTGCPRNCAEITVKDIGVMAISGGWEVYVGGAAGMHVRKGDLLCTVPTAEEALRAVSLFLQRYREDADYLERTYRYLEREGIDAVRAATVDAPPAVQDALLERLARSRAAVADPWDAEGAQPRTANQFTAIPVGVQR